METQVERPVTRNVWVEIQRVNLVIAIVDVQQRDPGGHPALRKPIAGGRIGLPESITREIGIVAAILLYENFRVHLAEKTARMIVDDLRFHLLLVPLPAPVPDDEEFLASLPQEMEQNGVFISYASEDLEAACRIARKLRDARVPVWLDKEQLRAGVDYEKKIKAAIKIKSRLFISLISQATEASASGRFVHKERAWAAERHVAGTSFYVPVIIDSTDPQKVHREPPCFSKIHREVLAGGIPTRQFCKRIKALRE